MDEQSDRARQAIGKIIYITLATANKNGKPWNTPLYSVHNDKYVFYWASSPTAIHSVNLNENPDVAIVIYNSQAPAGEGFGVYIEAKASMVTDMAELESAFKLFRKSKFIGSLDDLMGDSPLRLYKAIPEKAWVNGITKVNGRYVDKRDQISLA